MKCYRILYHKITGNYCCWLHGGTLLAWTEKHAYRQAKQFFRGFGKEWEYKLENVLPTDFDYIK